jgi:hypothetical protein
VREPLDLPTGCVRTLLIAGFCGAAVLAYRQGRLSDENYLEFFVVLFSMVLGHLFGRTVGRLANTPLHVAVIHVKAALVLLSAGASAALLVTDLHTRAPVPVMVGMACFVAFYFGSRS